MAYHASLNVSRMYGAAWSPWAQGAIAPTAGAIAPTTGVAPTMGACGTVMGPVANICQSSVPVTRQVPVTQMVPVTTVTPVTSTVQPQAYVGAPVTQAPMAGGYGKGMGTYGKGMGTFGKGAKTMGAAPVVPGLYTSEAGVIGW